MVDNTAKQGLDALAKSIVDSLEATAATEQAVQKQIQSVLGSTSATLNDLVKNNTYTPEQAQEHSKLQKAIIARTISAIEALNPPTLGGAPKKGEKK